MKTFIYAAVAAAAFAAPAMADELDPMCEAFGELTAAGFEARLEGVEEADAFLAAVEEIDDVDLIDAVAAIFTEVYAMELSEDEDEAEDAMTTYIAEIMIACEDGLAEG